MNTATIPVEHNTQVFRRELPFCNVPIAHKRELPRTTTREPSPLDTSKFYMANAEVFVAEGIARLQAQAVSYVVEIWKRSSDDLSTYGDCQVINIGEDVYKEIPKADFYEPLEYSWTERRSQIRKIAKEYSE